MEEIKVTQKELQEGDILLRAPSPLDTVGTLAFRYYIRSRTPLYMACKTREERQRVAHDATGDVLSNFGVRMLMPVKGKPEHWIEVEEDNGSLVVLGMLTGYSSESEKILEELKEVAPLYQTNELTYEAVLGLSAQMDQWRTQWATSQQESATASSQSGSDRSRVSMIPAETSYDGSGAGPCNKGASAEGNPRTNTAAGNKKKHPRGASTGDKTIKGAVKRKVAASKSDNNNESDDEVIVLDNPPPPKSQKVDSSPRQRRRSKKENAVKNVASSAAKKHGAKGSATKKASSAKEGAAMSPETEGLQLPAAWYQTAAHLDLVRRMVTDNALPNEESTTQQGRPLVVQNDDEKEGPPNGSARNLASTAAPLQLPSEQEAAENNLVATLKKSDSKHQQAFLSQMNEARSKLVAMLAEGPAIEQTANLGSEIARLDRLRSKLLPSEQRPQGGNNPSESAMNPQPARVPDTPHHQPSASSDGTEMANIDQLLSAMLAERQRLVKASQVSDSGVKNGDQEMGSRAPATQSNPPAPAPDTASLEMHASQQQVPSNTQAMVPGMESGIQQLLGALVSQGVQRGLAPFANANQFPIPPPPQPSQPPSGGGNGSNPPDNPATEASAMHFLATQQTNSSDSTSVGQGTAAAKTLDDLQRAFVSLPADQLNELMLKLNSALAQTYQQALSAPQGGAPLPGRASVANAAPQLPLSAPPSQAPAFGGAIPTSPYTFQQNQQIFPPNQQILPTNSTSQLPMPAPPSQAPPFKGVHPFPQNQQMFPQNQPLHSTSQRNQQILPPNQLLASTNLAMRPPNQPMIPPNHQMFQMNHRMIPPNQQAMFSSNRQAMFSSNQQPMLPANQPMFAPQASRRAIPKIPPMDVIVPHPKKQSIPRGQSQQVRPPPKEPLFKKPASHEPNYKKPTPGPATQQAATAATAPPNQDKTDEDARQQEQRQRENLISELSQEALSSTQKNISSLEQEIASTMNRIRALQDKAPTAAATPAAAPTPNLTTSLHGNTAAKHQQK